MLARNHSIYLLALSIALFFSPKLMLSQDTLSMNIDEAIDWMEMQIVEGGKQRKWKSIYFRIDVENNFISTLHYKELNEMGLLDEHKFSFYLNDLATMDDKVLSGYDDLTLLTKLNQQKIILARTNQMGKENKVKESIKTFRRIAMVTLPMPKPEISWQAKDIIKQLIAIAEKDEVAKLEKDKINLENEILKVAYNKADN